MMEWAVKQPKTPQPPKTCAPKQVFRNKCSILLSEQDRKVFHILVLFSSSLSSCSCSSSSSCSCSCSCSVVHSCSNACSSFSSSSSSSCSSSCSCSRLCSCCSYRLTYAACCPVQPLRGCRRLPWDQLFNNKSTAQSFLHSFLNTKSTIFNTKSIICNTKFDFYPLIQMTAQREETVQTDNAGEMTDLVQQWWILYKTMMENVGFYTKRWLILY